jgi:hypothetical protein
LSVHIKATANTISENIIEPQITRRNFVGAAMLAATGLYGLPDVASARSELIEDEPQVVLPHTPGNVSKLYNLPVFNTNDIEDIESGGADGVVLWAPEWIEEEPKPGNINKDEWIQFEERLIATQAIKNRYVVVSSVYPPWAYKDNDHRKGLKDTGPNGPFSYFQRRVADHIPAGIIGIGSLNEYNKYSEGQEDSHRKKQAAELLISSDIAYDDVGFQGLHIMLNSADVIDNRGYNFNLDVVNKLILSKHNFKLETTLGHHFYEDCKQGTTYGIELESQLATILPGGNNMLFLLEGGYKFRTILLALDYFGYGKGLQHEDKRQLNNFLKIWELVNNRLDNVQAIANYTREDNPNGSFMSGTFRTNGTPHLLGKVFAKL